MDPHTENSRSREQGGRDDASPETDEAVEEKSIDGALSGEQPNAKTDSLSEGSVSFGNGR